MDSPFVILEPGAFVSLKEGTRFFPTKNENVFVIIRIETKQRFRRGFGGVENYQIITIVGDGKMRKVERDEIDKQLPNPMAKEDGKNNR